MQRFLTKDTVSEPATSTLSTTFSMNASFVFVAVLLLRYQTAHAATDYGNISAC